MSGANSLTIAAARDALRADLGRVLVGSSRLAHIEEGDTDEHEQETR